MLFATPCNSSASSSNSMAIVMLHKQRKILPDIVLPPAPPKKTHPRRLSVPGMYAGLYVSKSIRRKYAQKFPPRKKTPAVCRGGSIGSLS